MDLPEFWQKVFLLIAFPLIGAGIGWLTNRLAIQMLFRPRKPWRILGVNFQGLIPRRQGELAIRVGEIVETELFNQHLIQSEIRKMDLKPHLDQLATNLVWDRLAPKLKALPVFGGFVNDRLLYTLTKMAIEALQGETDQLLEKVSVEVEKKIAVRKIVEDKVRCFDLDQLEAIVRKLAHNEFQRIEILGAVIGLVVGGVQSGLLVIAQLT